MFFTCHLGIICSLVGHGIGRNQNKLLKQKFFLEKKKANLWSQKSFVWRII